MPAPDTVRVGGEIRDQLITLKRRTGVMNWNVLCRWALCRSLSEPTAPGLMPTSGDATVEMTWKTFAGPAGDIYWWLIKQHTRDLGLPLDEHTLSTQLRAHIVRGTQYLVGDQHMKDTQDLVALIKL
ncbi:DNA sulfur modification protein DndE [Allocatelliglobosispora scoriae]|uniref:DNA sulfur modification protein DndE n=1 Tax=Allocatelliglobosispora scoriae TaxID=643052 RepID=A0A841BYA3_9ACTN|nr:DNA sulfur modification protein DndE [Allocatelliglobosispora scoriae]MBB5871903.1 DNA sulfur modification protein DndE [Allocatelliglobosispora scoriae]